MPSPFPGMNPFLEQDDVWHDFHERFLPLVAEWLGAQLLPHYIVKLDEHIYVHELATEPRRFPGRADLAVTPAARPAAAWGAVGIADAPVAVQLPAVDIERLTFVEIRDRRNRELITVVELLSPSNKRSGPDREQYLAKRARILASPVHLVEVDLLRGGQPMPAEERPPCDYSVLVSRAPERPRAGFWPIGLRDRLPAVPIPVRPSDPEARLDLQDALDRLYDAAGYHYYIYEGTLDPPLELGQLAWARPFIHRSTMT